MFFSASEKSAKLKELPSDSKDSALEAMRAHFVGQESADGMPLNDETFLRYLRARNFQVEKSIPMLEATIAWRKEFGLSELYLGNWNSILSLENSTGKMYCRGQDNNGHATLYMRPKFENTNDHDGNLKHVVYNLERSIQWMEKSTKQEKLVLLIDYDGYSLMNAPPMKTSTETLNILQNHYPERLFRAYCIRPPWIFNAFWSMISPFIDPVTKSKVKMVSAADMQAALSPDMDMSQVETSLGGRDDRPFDSGLYLRGEIHQNFLDLLDGPAPTLAPSSSSTSSSSSDELVSVVSPEK